ncbi:MAG: alkaline phosphatase family protein [bacterium]
MQRNKLLLIGWDAADWDIIWPLINQGKMPALKSLIAKGVYGNISTMKPPYSPMLWTSVVTGKTPDKHGVLGFIEVTPDATTVRPVTTTSRKTRALWNIFHNQGMKSNLVGWWPSFPAEPINGYVISDRFPKTHRDPMKQTPMSEFAIHPWKDKDEFKHLRMFPFEVTEAHLYPFVPRAHDVDQENHKGLTAIAKILSENTSIHNGATKLLRTTEWDFMAVYYDLIDHFCHSFMKYHPPKLPSVDANNYDIFKEAVTGAYIYQDMMLERKLQLIDENTTVIVMSDHGFESGPHRILNMPKVQAAPSLEHREFGIFVAAGPNIKKGEKIFGMGLIDVAPTILHHFGFPVGKDMDGKVVLDIFKESDPPSYIESWDLVEGDFAELKEIDVVNPFSDDETMQQLVELGYVEKLDEKHETAIRKTQIDLKHNLARVHLGKKDFDKARSILTELVNLKYDDIDTAPFCIDMITIALNEKKFEEAFDFLNRVKNSNTEVKFNLDLIESQILTELGRPKDALKILESSKSSNAASTLHRIGNLYVQLGDFNEAVTVLERAIEKQPEKAMYHTAMAEAMLGLKNYEEAAEYALTSIELVKFYPKSHFILGQALEGLGDLENAKLAFEMASKLQPKKYHKAEFAKQNVEKKQFENSSIIRANEYHEDQIVIVSGLPRSGTSLMMQMIHHGGIEALTDDNRKADISNPKGYFEYDPVMALYKDNSWLHKATNKSIKVVAPLLKYLDSKYRYKVIFMNRDLNEIVKSQQIMLKKNPEELPVHLFESYKKQLHQVELWQESEPGVEILQVNYAEIMSNPEPIIQKIKNFTGQDLNHDAMLSCIDKTLYRTKAD